MQNIIDGFLYLYEDFTFMQKIIVITSLIGLVLSFLAIIGCILEMVSEKFRWRAIMFAEKTATSIEKWNDDFYDRYYNKPIWADRDLYDQTCLSRTKKK